MEALLLLSKRFLLLGAALLGMLSGSPLAWAQKETALYVSPAGHNFRADGMPLQSPETVRASLRIAADLGVRRVYWRGFQEQYLLRHAQFQPANFLLSEYWEWLRELDGTRGIHQAALDAVTDAGMEIWGVFGLFDLGSDPREDAYCGAAAGFGPLVFSDSIRIEFSDEIPRDRSNIRTQCGTIRFSNPAVRKKLISRLSALMDEGYDGLLLYTYSEHLSLWFAGEFDQGSQGPLGDEEVKNFVRELRQELSRKQKKLALQVDPRPAFRYLPSPWLGLTSEVNNVGQIAIAWEEWLREGLLDEIVFSVPPDAGAGALEFVGEMSERFPQIPFSLLVRNTPLPAHTRSVALDARSAEWRSEFLLRARSVEALASWAESTEGKEPSIRSLLRADSAAVAAGLKSTSVPTTRDMVDLVKARREFSIRQQAAETLAGAGALAADALRELASDDDPSVRRVAFHAAEKLSDLKAARPFLEQAIDDPEPYNRWHGFRGLARLPFDAELQKQVARTLREESNPTVRSVAAWLVRPGLSPEPELIEALKEHFVALHRQPSWSWEYRTVGDALVACGSAGRAFLESCLTREGDANLSDSAWRCLFIPQSGGKLHLVSAPEAAQAYRAHPKAR